MNSLFSVVVFLKSCNKTHFVFPAQQRGRPVLPREEVRWMRGFLQEKPRIRTLQAGSRMEDVSYLEPMKLYFVLISLRQLGNGTVWEFVLCSYQLCICECLCISVISMENNVFKKPYCNPESY